MENTATMWKCLLKILVLFATKPLMLSRFERIYRNTPVYSCRPVIKMGTDVLLHIDLHPHAYIVPTDLFGDGTFYELSQNLINSSSDLI